MSCLQVDRGIPLNVFSLFLPHVDHSCSLKKHNDSDSHVLLASTNHSAVTHQVYLKFAHPLLRYLRWPELS